MKILTFTTLFPNRSQSRHGIFVEQRLTNLLREKRLTAKVVAPVPWFPSRNRKSGNFYLLSRVPHEEKRNGLSITHPRYLSIPIIGKLLNPIILAISTLRHIKNIIESGYEFDLIDAHYFFPDGVAAAIIGNILNKPVIITARGTDINLFPRFYFPRKQITWAAGKAASIITVSTALKEKLCELGVNNRKIHVIRNGVDIDNFSLLDKSSCRAELKISGNTLLSVGNLVELKGHDLVIKALRTLHDFRLIIIGRGELQNSLKTIARDCGVEQRVRFVEEVTQGELAKYYSAADILVLASSREGLPNVLLESLACGTPAVTTNVGGIPEVMSIPTTGIMMSERTEQAIVDGVYKVFNDMPSRTTVRSHIKNMSWEKCVDQVLAVMSMAISNSKTFHLSS